MQHACMLLLIPCRQPAHVLSHCLPLPQEFTEAVTRSYQSGRAVSLPLLD